MEHKASCSSKDDGAGRFHMYGSSYQIQQYAAAHTLFSVPQSQAPAQKSECGSTYVSDLSNYMESFPFADYSSSPVLSSGPSRRRLDAPLGISPEALLDVISLTQRKLQHLEAIVRMMIQGSGHRCITQQQQSLSMEFASIMSQLFAATATFSSPFTQQASSPAPQVNDTFDFSFDGFNEDELNNTLGSGPFCHPPSGMDATNAELYEGTCMRFPMGAMDSRPTEVGPVPSSNEAANMFTSGDAHRNIDERDLAKGTPNGTSKSCVVHENDNQVLISSEDHKEEDDDGDGEVLPPGSYELVELAATEILAEHTHFCEICSKGFKRDANLRMHMRGHGDEYKTAAALARPDKAPRDGTVLKLRRYSCPYAGCKRNKKHHKFQPLKTMLCVKNHYRRSHCPKVLVCSRCKAKKFSVVADLKTHEKHCGQDKWQCSCGTTFSRKDKLYGHLGLFAGHMPATLANEVESLGGFGDGLEGFTSSKANASGIAGLSAAASATQDNVAASYVNVSREMNMNAHNAVMMDTRAKKNDGGFLNEKSSNDREKNVFLSFSTNALMRDSSFPSSASTEIASDGSELHSLLSDGLFH